MNSKNDLLIRISPESRRIIVESTGSEVKSVKEILPETFLECVKNSISREKNRMCSGFLPRNCFHVAMCEDGTRDYCIWHPRLRADISYFGTEYNDFPLPRLVFGMSVSPEGKVYRCRLGVSADEPPRESTPMYVYPFSNVSGFGLCTGNNELPVYKNRSKLATLPDYLLRLPNNNDSFNPRHNKLNLEYRDLLEHLKKKKPAYYYTDVLVPNGKTLRDFMGEQDGH